MWPPGDLDRGATPVAPEPSEKADPLAAAAAADTAFSSARSSAPRAAPRPDEEVGDRERNESGDFFAPLGLLPVGRGGEEGGGCCGCSCG